MYLVTISSDFTNPADEDEVVGCRGMMHDGRHNSLGAQSAFCSQRSPLFCLCFANSTSKLLKPAHSLHLELMRVNIAPALSP